MKDQDQLNKAISLLEEALYFTNMVPNKIYKTRSFKDSYELAANIQNFIKEVKDDTREYKN